MESFGNFQVEEVTSSPQAISLRELTSIVAHLVSDSSTRDRWVTAEIMDFAVRGGHCYMELVDKDADTGKTLAKLRAIIWASVYPRMSAMFCAATGQQLASGLKVMVKVTVNFHSVFGISAVISDIDPGYTMGDLVRRRNMMIQQLKDEGIYDMNRSLPWPDPTLRIAVVSARGAAGYGDFIHQLYSNPLRLRFTTRLFEAVMQGERAPASIVAALGRIAAEADEWDAVAIIRGGGATSDLVSLDNYELASHVAQFPLPVIVGVGHERDVTILDYVAGMRVKTPTAAAEWLVGRAGAQLDGLRDIATRLLRAVSDTLSGNSRQLSFYQGQIPVLAAGVSQRAAARLQRYGVSLSAVASGRIVRRLDGLSAMSDKIAMAVSTRVRTHADRLDAAATLLKVLSPEATLKRGYSITRIDGHSVTSAEDVPAGATLVTTLASGTITSTVNQS